MTKNSQVAGIDSPAKSKSAGKLSPRIAAPAKAKAGSRKGVNTFSGYLEAKMSKRLDKVVAILGRWLKSELASTTSPISPKKSHSD